MKRKSKTDISRIANTLFRNLIASEGLRNSDKISKTLRSKILEEKRRRKSQKKKKG